MTVTTDYGRLHWAFARAAECFVCSPTLARVAVAVHDRGGSATSHEIEADTMLDGSGVRRALLEMYDRELARGVGADGGPRRRGVVTRVRLTRRGRLLAGTAVEYATPIEEAKAA